MKECIDVYPKQTKSASQGGMGSTLYTTQDVELAKMFKAEWIEKLGMGSGDVVQLVKCLSSMKKALGLAPVWYKLVLWQTQHHNSLHGIRKISSSSPSGT